MRILVLGVGNILLTDEAIGVHIAEALAERYILPDYVEVMDGGTAGMELLDSMAGRDHLIITDAIVTAKSARAPSAFCGMRRFRHCSLIKSPRISWGYPMSCPRCGLPGIPRQTDAGGRGSGLAGAGYRSDPATAGCR